MRIDDTTGDDNSDRTLDRLLARARWPEPDAARLERLRRRWSAFRGGQPNASFWAIAAIAAGLLLATGTACWRLVAPRGIAPAKAARNDLALLPGAHSADASPERRPPQVPHSSFADPPANELPRQAAAFTARDPTAYEQLVIESLTRRRRAQPTRAKPKLDQRLLDDVLQGITLIPPANQARAKYKPGRPTDATAEWITTVRHEAERLAPQPDRYERALWVVLRTTDGTRRLAAARLLSQIGTTASIAILCELGAAEETHEPAVVGLARLAEPEELAQWTRSEAKGALRQQLLAAFIERGTIEAVTMFVELAAETSLAADALVVAERTTGPAVEALFALLEAPQVSLRMAAARTLGVIRDPLVVRRLAEYVVDGVSRHEALVGLLSSPNPEARAFLNQARQDFWLTAAVQAAETEFPLLNPDTWR